MQTFGSLNFLKLEEQEIRFLQRMKGIFMLLDTNVRSVCRMGDSVGLSLLQKSFRFLGKNNLVAVLNELLN